MNSFCDNILNFDEKLFLFFNGIPVPSFVDYFFASITNVSFLAIVAILIMVAIGIKFKKKAILIIVLLLLGVGVGDFSGAKMKRASKVMRPCHPELNLDAKFLDGRKKSSSFPSNHAINWAFITIFLYLVFKDKNELKKARIALLAFGAITAYSRVAVGVHYPMDIVFGYLYGMLWAMIFFKLYKQINLCINNKLETK